MLTSGRLSLTDRVADMRYIARAFPSREETQYITSGKALGYPLGSGHGISAIVSGDKGPLLPS